MKYSVIAHYSYETINMNVILITNECVIFIHRGNLEEITQCNCSKSLSLCNINQNCRFLFHWNERIKTRKCPRIVYTLITYSHRAECGNYSLYCFEGHLRCLVDLFHFALNPPH